MATYKEIKGVTIQTLDDDPVEGGVPGATWSSGGALNTARSGLTSNAVGTQTAGMASGGSVSPRQQNEQYNGSAWTEVGDLTSGHSFAGAFGTSTASILAGGETPSMVDTVEVWDGSSWTETTEINTARSSMGAYGSSYTAGAVIGGYGFILSGARAITTSSNAKAVRTTLTGTWRFIGKCAYRSAGSGGSAYAQSQSALAIRIS